MFVSYILDIPGTLQQIKVDIQCEFELTKPQIFSYSFDQIIPKEKFQKELNEKLEKAQKDDPTDPFIETIQHELDFLATDALKIAEKIPLSQQRLLKSHLPFELLPQDLLQKNKV